MDQTIPENLLDQFFSIVDKGDEEKARKFLLDHLNEFPEESRDAIITAFVEDALTKEADGSVLMGALKKKGIEEAHSLSSFKKELEKQEKLLEIKKGL
jgi:hypothetical protein